MHILSCLQRPVLFFSVVRRMILSTDLKTVAFINLACAHPFLLEKGVQAVKLKSRPIFWTLNSPFLVSGVEARYE